MLGGSLGTFLLCDFLNEFPEEKIDGIILMGMGYQNAGIVSVVIRMMRKEAVKIGWNYSSPFVKKLSFGVYNNRFKPNRTYIDWLCSDEKEIDKYIEDALCRECISAGLFVDLLSAIKRSTSRNIYANWKKEMPVLILSGKEDPLGNKGKGLFIIKKKMQISGLKDVQMEIVESARHDVLHEYQSGAATKAKEIIERWISHNKHNFLL